MIPKPKKPHEENVDAWLMSYADMITLLLCFFIIFVSVSEPKKDKLTNITDGMVGKFGAVAVSTPLKDAVQSLQQVVEKNELYRDVAIMRTSNGVEMELSSGRFFKQSSAEFDEAIKPKLDDLMAALKQSEVANFNIIIESHTDDTPTSGGLYPTNWELSSVRAAKIARIFVDNGFNPQQLKPTGYGDSKPKVPNRDAKGNAIEQNQLKNQRIVIKLERVT